MPQRTTRIGWLRRIVANWLMRMVAQIQRETPEAPEPLPIEPVLARLRARFPDAPQHWLAMVAMRSPDFAAAPAKMAAVAPRLAAPSHRDPRPVTVRPRTDPKGSSAEQTTLSAGDRPRMSAKGIHVDLRDVPVTALADRVGSPSQPVQMRRRHPERPRMNVVWKTPIRRESPAEPRTPQRANAVPRDVVAVDRPGGDAAVTVVRETGLRPVAAARRDEVPNNLRLQPERPKPPASDLTASIAGVKQPTAGVKQPTRSVALLDNPFNDLGPVLRRSNASAEPGVFESPVRNVMAADRAAPWHSRSRRSGVVVLPKAVAEPDHARILPPIVGVPDAPRRRAPAPSLCVDQEWAQGLWPSLPESDLDGVEFHETRFHQTRFHETDGDRLRQMVRDQEAP